MDPDLFNELPLQERLLLVKEHGEWLATNECGIRSDHLHIFFMLHGLVIEVYFDCMDLEMKDVQALRYSDEGITRLLYNIWLGPLQPFTQQGDAPF